MPSVLGDLYWRVDSAFRCCAMANQIVVQAVRWPVQIDYGRAFVGQHQLVSRQAAIQPITSVRYRDKRKLATINSNNKADISPAKNRYLRGKLGNLQAREYRQRGAAGRADADAGWRNRSISQWSTAIRGFRHSCCCGGRRRARTPVGASPVSTGQPGSFDHFQTLLGVFEHTVSNPDYRALGTPYRAGIRGNGVKGMRIFDFGWQRAPKSWGDGAVSQILLQMHATDPDLLEPRLGTAQSKGCIRIPATLNRFLDRFGVLDAAYEESAQDGASFGCWIRSANRRPG